MMTLYGRKPVLEVLLDPGIRVFRLHLADSNARSDIMREIEQLADTRQIETVFHSRQALSRISKNGKQDQGVAVDVEPLNYAPVDTLPENHTDLLALDCVTNPQNLGMIIRSFAASPMHGLLIPKKGCATIDPLVHKASAGTLFKSRLYYSPTLLEGLQSLKPMGFQVIGLDAAGKTSIAQLPPADGTRRIFVLGNESSGLSTSTLDLCDELASISLSNAVESINVAAAATLVAFRGIFQA